MTSVPMFEYTLSARLHAVTTFNEARFSERLSALAQRLEGYLLSAVGTPSQYEVTVHLPAGSEAEAIQRWWQEVEPALERESLGSLTAVYSALPHLTPAAA